MRIYIDADDLVAEADGAIESMFNNWYEETGLEFRIRDLEKQLEDMAIQLNHMERNI